ncbi:unnamed protein product [Peniophora sp. CBMAI 1063]|nr:unnamed protein product [Peniophora sp. CBMAI 1063]
MHAFFTTLTICAAIASPCLAVIRGMPANPEDRLRLLLPSSRDVDGSIRERSLLPIELQPGEANPYMNLNIANFPSKRLFCTLPGCRVFSPSSFQAAKKRDTGILLGFQLGPENVQNPDLFGDTANNGGNERRSGATAVSVGALRSELVRARTVTNSGSGDEKRAFCSIPGCNVGYNPSYYGTGEGTNKRSANLVERGINLGPEMSPALAELLRGLTTTGDSERRNLYGGFAFTEEERQAITAMMGL